MFDITTYTAPRKQRNGRSIQREYIYDGGIGMYSRLSALPFFLTAKKGTRVMQKSKSYYKITP